MTYLRLIALLFPLLLTSCLLLPGPFDAALTIERTGNFSFSYNGEIVIGPPDESPPPEKAPDEETEIDLNAAMNQGFAEMATQFMGGLDPDDEEAVRAFAARLEARDGWDRVDYLGGGRFAVEYQVEGTLTHDFVFPLVPDFFLNFPMFSAVWRDDGTIAVKGLALLRPDEDEDSPGPGRFTFTTDGGVVSSNGTVQPDDGSGRSVISWDSEEPREEPAEAVIQIAS